MNRVDQIRESALKLFLEKGYGSTSIRDIAAKAGINSATLYHYFPSKQDILLNVISTNWKEIFGELDKRMAAIQGSWTDKLHAFVEFHAEWHCLHGDQMRIISSELRSVEDGFRVRASAHRDKYEGLLRAILEQGNAIDEFRLKDVPVVSFAVLQMLTGIAQWYRPDGRLKSEEICDLYWDLVRKMVCAQPEVAQNELLSCTTEHTAGSNPVAAS